jgi:adenosine kinase
MAATACCNMRASFARRAFHGEELMNFIHLADYVTVNDYEAELLQERTGKGIEKLAEQVRALIVTMGAKGSVIHAGGKTFEIPSVKPYAILDPTGCGDAYRAGLLYGILNGMDWAVTGRLAALLGSIKIAQRGGQNHTFARDDIAAQYKAQFGATPW